tara:strand:+ start:432 stop:599 length:168 start_codon:yes stop_codon:yes gene_type:complete
MTVEQLIKELQQLPKDNIVVITEPDQIGWDNIGKVVSDGVTIKIVQCGNGVFHED